MNFLDLVRAVFGLAFTLGLIGIAAWAARRYAPQLLARLGAERGARRLQVVETLVPVSYTHLTLPTNREV